MEAERELVCICTRKCVCVCVRGGGCLRQAGETSSPISGLAQECVYWLVPVLGRKHSESLPLTLSSWASPLTADSLNQGLSHGISGLTHPPSCIRRGATGEPWKEKTGLSWSSSRCPGPLIGPPVNHME